MISRHTFRKTLKWFGVILLLAGTAAGGYGYWLWYHCDEYLLEQLIQKQQQFAPDWDVEIGRAHFDWHRRVHIYNVKIKAKGQKRTIATLPEVILAIDRKKFERNQKIEIQTVRVLNPVLQLRRDVSGHWNWRELLTLKPSNRSLPEWTIEEATFKLFYAQKDQKPPTEITLAHSFLKLIPSGKRRFKLLGKAELHDQGNIRFQGDWSVDAKRWSIHGDLNDIQRTGELLQLAAGTSPVFRNKLIEFGEDLHRTRLALSLPEETRVAARPDARMPLSLPRTPPTGDNGLPELGFESTVDLKFQVAQSAPGREWEFRMAMNLEQGTLSHPVLPFPLRGLAGEVYWDNRTMEFRDLTAQNGTTRIALNGNLNREKPHATGNLQIDVTNLLLDRRLRGRLPPSLRKQYDAVQPSGPADVQLALSRTAGEPWKPRDFVLTAKGCGAVNQKFPYPVTDLVGTMKQRGRDLLIDLTGQAGGRQVRIFGEVDNPGPEAETAFDIRVKQFPLDDRFRQACDPVVRDVLGQMNLNGWADVHLSLYRPPGPGREFITKIGASLKNCEIHLEAFPYRVTKLAGNVTYRSDQKRWSFEELQGEHGTTRLSAVGSYNQAVAPGELKMKITTQGGAFDESLHRALPDQARTVWANFSPGGKFDTVSKIRWVPNMGFEWSLPEAKIYDGRMKLKSFPYDLTNVNTELSFNGERCQIKSFTAEHDDTRIRGRGNAFLPTQGPWEINLEKLYVDDLSPDRRFRQALPSGLRTVVEELDPRRPFSFSGGIRFAGTERETDPILASWNLNFAFTGNRLNTGIPLKNVLGQVSARGTWDGKKAENVGRIKLESVEVLDYQLTKVEGPYRIDGDKVVIGSEKVFDPRQNERAIPLTERLTAGVIDGKLTYDAQVFLEKQVRYRSRLHLIDGRLEEYARRYLPGTKNLRGMMNGWLDLSGQGVKTSQMTGAGQLRVSPAALYELPILAQVWQVLTLAGPDRTAFRFASVDFEIAKNQFVFNVIDLVGESLSLRGKGTAGFDGRLNIDFYSMLPRARLPWPVANWVNPVLDQATKDWVRVEVRGKTSRPEVDMKPVPVVDETIKRFLGILGTGMPGDLRPFPAAQRQ